MPLIDTHAHLDLPRFGNAQSRRDAATRAHRATVVGVLVPAVDPNDWDSLLACTAQLEREVPEMCFRTALGVHPQALTWSDPAKDADHLAALSERYRTPPASVVAIGECGLDFGPRGQGADRDRQVAVLQAHLALARQTGLPLILHCLHAHAVLLELLLAAATPPCVLHSWSGSAELALRFCAAGHYISFAGAITLANARRLRAAACAVPLDRLLIETDSPDQTPVARRPEPNEPAFLPDIAAAVAEARAQSFLEVSEHCTLNARKLLQFP